MTDVYFAGRAAAEPDWSRIPAVRLDNRYLDTAKDIAAWSQVCCNDRELLVHQWIEVPYVRAQEHGPLGVPCEDSCLEFFFCPIPGDDRYMNIEFNMNGCMYWGIGTGLHDLIRLIPDQTDNPFSPTTVQNEKGWELFYRIPYVVVKRLFPEFDSLEGTVIRGNFFACSDLTQPPYYLSWQPIPGDPFTFHRSECFGAIPFPRRDQAQ